MSLWKWTAVVNGWNDAHTPDDGSLDDDEALELFEFAQG
jgi:hypothetical protein